MLLVDPSYTHQLRGRPKTDRRDCQWIYRLHSRRPAGRGLPARRADLPAAGLPAAAGQPGPLGQPARAAHAEGPGADEPEADGGPQRHHRGHRAGHHPGDPARHAGAGEVGQVPGQGLQGQRGPDRPGPDRDVPGGAPVRAEAGLRGLAVHPEAGGEGGRADRPAAGADEVRPGLAAADAEEASEPEGQRAAVRRADGVVLRGGAGPDGDRGDQRADGVDDHQRDRPGGVEVPER